VQLEPLFAAQGEEDWARVEARLSKAQLTDEQKAKLNDIKREFLMKREKMAEHVKESQAEIDYNFAEDSFDKENVTEEREELRKLRDHWRRERQTLGRKIWAMLTPEQHHKLGPSVQKAHSLFPTGRFEDEWARIENRLKKVALTDKQKTELSALKSEFLKKKQDMLEHVREARWEIDYIMSEDSFDKETLAEELEELRGIRKQWKKDREAFGAKIFAMLTPEQQNQLGPNIKKAQNLFPGDWIGAAGHGLGFGPGE